MQKLNKTPLFFLLVALIGAYSSPNANGVDEDRLLTYVPQDANLIILLNLESSKNAEMGLQSQIQNQFEQHAGHIPYYVPSSINKILLAAEVDWGTLRSEWEIGVAEFQNDKVELNAFEDRIFDKPCCVQNGVQFVRLDSNKVGLMWPAKRQKVSRWVQNSLRQAKPVVSDYLSAALVPEKIEKLDMILALDLVDAIDPTVLRQAFAESSVLKKLDVNIDDITDLFKGLMGGRITVAFGNPSQGQLFLDFSDDLKPVDKLVAKPLLLHLLKTAGFGLKEFQEWQVSIDGTVLSMTGNLSEPGIRRLTKLIAIDPSLLRTLKGEGYQQSGPTKASERYAKIIAQRDSKFFVDQIEQTVNDLQTGWRTVSPRLAQRAFFVSRAAQKIQRLSSRNVPDELLDYANQIAELLYSISDEMQNAIVNSTSAYSGNLKSLSYGAIPYRAITTPDETYFRYAPYAYWDVDLSGDEKAEERLATAEQFSSKSMREINALLKEMKTEFQKHSSSKQQ